MFTMFTEIGRRQRRNCEIVNIMFTGTGIRKGFC